LHSDQQSHAAAADSAVGHCAYQGKIYIKPNGQMSDRDVSLEIYIKVDQSYTFELFLMLSFATTEKKENQVNPCRLKHLLLKSSTNDPIIAVNKNCFSHTI